MPPELFQNRSYKAKQTTVWQLGVVMYAVLHGQLPFYEIEKLVFVNPPLDANLSMCKSSIPIYTHAELVPH